MKNNSRGDRRDSNKSILDRVVDYVCTPCYQPSEAEAKTFQALGFSRPTIEAFWVVFCRINTSLLGEISREEFYSYFNFGTGSSQFMDRCFEYFDVTGGGQIGFLEFMVSVWNICTLKIDTLTNFTFDMYDLDFDGELSLPEIERMIQELFGRDLKAMGNHILSDINSFAEQRGGTLNITSFTIYTATHSILLFPIFVIQRKVQHKVMGIRYWRDVENMRPDYGKGKKKMTVRSKMKFDHRHIQNLMRTHKKNDITSLLDHTEESIKGSANVPDRNILKTKVKHEKFKSAVERLKTLGEEKQQTIEKVKMKCRKSVENAVENVVDKAVDVRSKTKKTFIRLASMITRQVHQEDSDGIQEIDSPKKTINHHKVIESHSFHEEKDSNSENVGRTVIGYQRHKTRKTKTAPSVGSNGQSKIGSHPTYITPVRPRAPGMLIYHEMK